MSEGTGPVVETREGPVAGATEEGVDIFRAIPYAAAPMGHLRWARPQPAPRRETVLDGSARGALSIQPPSRLAHVMGDFDLQQDEDCLTLTVNRPAGGREGLPVLVWLHGGAFSTGGGDLPWYSGATLARDGDVIVVGVNYRLGALGFLKHPGLSPGNLGLMDQIAALEWIRDNISAFGGDPGNVTLFGQSAGAWSIAIHLANARAGGLFHRAILQSGPFGFTPQTEEQAAAVADRFLTELGLDPEQADLASAARAKKADAILTAQKATAAWYAETMPREGSPAIAYQPVPDGETVPAAEGYDEAILKGAERMDSIIGFTLNELTAFGAPLEPRREDTAFGTSSIAWAQRAAAAGRTVYFYRFDWSGPDSGVGACHCIELPFVFGTRAAFGDARMLAGGDPSEMDALAAKMGAAWIAFARTGNVGGTGLGDWPAVGSGGEEAMILDTDCRPAPLEGLG